MTYDAIVIGAGQAGPGIASTFAAAGERVALVERDRLGGTCLNYGCRPTKTWRASAHAAHVARRAHEFGVVAGEVLVDYAATKARKDRIIGGMQHGVDDYMTGLDGLDLYYAEARFLPSAGSTHRVRVGDDVLESERVYLNVGARPVVPPIPGLADVPHFTNEGLLALERLPSHLLVMGGSYIGLEFGQMFRRFGAAVTVIDRSPKLVPREDDDVADEVANVLRAEGVELVLGASVDAAEPSPEGVVLRLTDSSGTERALEGSHVLVAVGRRPNTDTLGLDEARVETDERGFIPVNGHFETNVPGIWAVGDVNGRGAFTHTSYQDHQILIDNWRGGDRSVDGRVMAYAMFIDPPLGRVGMGEADARASGRNVLAATIPMANVSRAQLDSEPHGLMKAFVDADTREILGALVFGESGDEIIQIFGAFMATGAPYEVLRDALPIHPTVAEFIPTLLGSLAPLE